MGEDKARLKAVDRLLKRPVFISGRGRSGTSLLARLFDGHPQIYGLPGESRVFTSIIPNLVQSGDRAAAAVEITARFPIHRADPTLQQRLQALDLASPTLGHEVMRICLERWTRRVPPAGERLFLEKTPKNEAFFSEIGDNFPTARFIYAVRDPRAVYVSNRHSQDFQMTPETFANQWLKSVRAMLKHMLRVGFRRRIHVLRFENLVGNPRATLEEVCRFMEIDWSESLMEPTRWGARWEGNAYALDRRTPDGIDAGKAQAWRTELSRAEEEAIVMPIWSEMALLGYSPNLLAEGDGAAGISNGGPIEEVSAVAASAIAAAAVDEASEPGRAESGR